MKPLQASRDAPYGIPGEQLPLENPDTEKARVSSAALLQRAYRRIALIARPRHVARKAFLRFLGAHIGRRNAIPPCSMPCPHQVWLGDGCRLELGIYFKFGKDVWIGENSAILKNVRIGDDAIIGAGSVLTKPIPTRKIWAGNPAHEIRDRE